MIKNTAVILSGGTGKRMGDIKLPKQFLEVCNVPIIILTLKNVLKSNLFNKILVVMHPDWFDYFKELCINYSIDTSKIDIISGGEERLGSIENALDYLKINANDDDIVVFLDAVRPFVTNEILSKAVSETKKYGVTVAISPVKDTMIFSENGIATDMPDRSKLFHGQAPDSFKFKLIYDSIKSLSDEEKKRITGTAQICQTKNITIHTFLGDEKNIKITTVMDLFLAKAIFKEMYGESASI